MELSFLSIAEIAAQIKSRAVSPVEVVRATLGRIDRLEPRLNAFITRMDESALAAARTAEREIAAGRYRGPLHGVPVSLKDLYWTKGVRTTAGSTILADFVPDEDSTAGARLAAAGAIVVGKTNLHEFAFGVTGENPHYGPTCNPWDLDRVPGGSSGGSAAEVAAGLSYGSLGSDSGGSIRIPASLCGLVGLKPTYGRVSRYGILPLAWSLDHAGPLARSVADAALLLGAIAGPDPRDPTAADVPVPDYVRELAGGVRGLRIGVPVDFFFDGLEPEVAAAVRKAIGVLGELGAVCEEVPLPQVRHARGALLEILNGEAGAYHLHWLQTRPEAYGPDVRDRLELAALTLAVDYVQAQRVRALVQAELRAALGKLDLIATPTTPTAATRIGESDRKINDVIGTPRNALPRLTSAFNATGLPAISVPCGFTGDGLPIGLQLAGRPFEETTVLRAAYAYEQATGPHPLPPLYTVERG